jgi:PAS domain S-box-containing protein
VSPAQGPLADSLVLAPDLREVSRARRFLDQVSAEGGFDDPKRFDIQVACSEAIANAIEHSTEKGEVMITASLHPDRLEVQIEGPGEFQPPSSSRDRSHRGLGLPLMASLSDHLALYSRPQGGTLVSLTFYRPGVPRKESEEHLPPSVRELIEENELISAITENAPFGIYVLGPDLHYRWANRAYKNFLDEPHRSRDIIGRSIEEVVPGALEAGIIADLEEVSRRGNFISRKEFQLTGYARGLTWWQRSAMPLLEGVDHPPYDVLVVVTEETERKRAEEAFLESQERVRRKLESILSPEASVDDLDLSDLINVPAIQSFLDDFQQLTRVPLAIIDLQGRVLVGAGWSDVCTEFHRVNPESCAHCIESDLELSAGVAEGDFKLYKCKNNMWDIATPIHVGDRHMGNIFSGQFFFEGESPDYGAFRAQAHKYGFNEEDYLRAIDAVPHFSRDTIASAMSFFAKLAKMLSQLGYSTVTLSRSLSERDELAASLEVANKELDADARRLRTREEELQEQNEELQCQAEELRSQADELHSQADMLVLANEEITRSEERFRTMADAIPQLAWIADADGYIYWYNQRWYEYTGTSLSEMEGWGWQSVHDSDALPGVRERWQGSIATGEPFDMEFPLLGADGIFRPFLTRVMPMKDPTGRVLQWFGTNTDLSERTRAEKAIKENEDRLSFALEVSHTGAWDLDLSDHTAHRSIEHDRIFGYESLLPEWTFEMFLDHVVPEDREIVDQKFQAAINARSDWSFECRIRRTDGEVRWIWAAGRHRPGVNGGWQMAGIVQDITGRKLAEERLLGLNRTLKAHSDSDQALIRATDEASYLDEVCRIVVEDCGHAMIWIGYKEDDEAKSIKPVASAGFEEGYLDTLKVTWADSERGRGPTGTAVRTATPSICRNMLTDPAFAPWRDEALRRGYASSLALPLVHSGTVFGAITIYASEPDPFSDEEVKLLADLSDDLALGITTLRLRAAHAETERERDILLAEEQQLTEELLTANEELRSQADELAAREDELYVQNAELRATRYNRTLIEASLDPLVTIGLEGTITDVNQATVKITGRTREELLNTDFSDYFTDPESARMGYREAFAKGSVVDYPLTVRARDGKLTDVLYNASLFRDEAGNVLGVFAAARDMTAVKELDEQRDIASILQNALLDLPQDLPGLGSAHLYRSATQKAVVGGDFYDVFKLKNGRVAILVGDVSGHGVGAARLATLVRDVIHAFAHQSSDPALILENTNSLLIEKEAPGFVTVFLGILDLESGLLVYTSAGHPNALLRSPSGEVELLQAASAPVGVFLDRSWEQNEVQLEKDDILLLYTDGAMEARRNGDFFGQEGLIKALEGWSDPSLELLPQTVLDQVLSFSGGELSDDVALLALRLEDAGKGLAGKG